MNKRFIGYAAAIFAALGAVNAQADTVGLTAITVNGDKMVNDSVLDVTWADVLGGGSMYPGGAAWNPWGVSYTGSVQQWIDSMNLSNYGGHNDWRLAKEGQGNTYLLDNSLCQPNSYSELHCLFNNELGNIPTSSGSPGPITDTGPFTSLTDGIHTTRWDNTVPGLVPSLVNIWSGSWSVIGYQGFYYNADCGCVSSGPSDYYYRALAVRTGQTLEAPPPVTPIPATVWLLLSSIGGLGVFARKRKA